MKSTDYAPRAAPFDAHLTAAHTVGIEIGVDVGAHAEALLRYTGVQTLFLVDTWPQPFHQGWCEGRLRALGFWPRVEMLRQSSLMALDHFPNAAVFDFIYLDQDQNEASADLRRWWPKLRSGGLFGVRNYAERWPQMMLGVDAFIAEHNLKSQRETGEMVIWKG